MVKKTFENETSLANSTFPIAEQLDKHRLVKQAKKERTISHYSDPIGNVIKTFHGSLPRIIR